MHSLDCDDDAAMGDVKKDIATMEAALKKLDEQESKYSVELESALQQYRELQAQASRIRCRGTDGCTVGTASGYGSHHHFQDPKRIWYAV